METAILVEQFGAVPVEVLPQPPGRDAEIASLRLRVDRLETVLSFILHQRPRSGAALLRLPMDPQAASRVTLVLEAVQRRYCVDRESLIIKGRRERVVWARHVAMYALREEVGLTFTEIGQIFGGRDHGTALHAHRKVGAWIKIYPQRKSEVEEVMAAVRRGP